MRVDKISYKFTTFEIVSVHTARLTGCHYAQCVCECGRFMLWMTRDTGMGPQWAKAANVVHRLSTGDFINGRLV